MRIIDNHIITNKQYFHLDNVACIELKRYGKISPVYDLNIRLVDNRLITKQYDDETAVSDFNQIAILLKRANELNFVQEHNTLINMDLVREVDFTYGMTGVNIEFPSFHHKILGLGKTEAEKSVDRLLKQYLENISNKIYEGAGYENTGRV